MFYHEVTEVKIREIVSIVAKTHCTLLYFTFRVIRDHFKLQALQTIPNMLQAIYKLHLQH